MLDVLFLCTGNSCRSQMAEGWTRHLRGGQITPCSAGVEAKGVHPLAIQVMAEAGVDIGDHRSQTLDAFADRRFDYVITVCGNALERCPYYPGPTRVIHVGFDDPPALAADAANQEEALQPFRRVRDEIRDFVLQMPEVLETLEPVKR